MKVGIGFVGRNGMEIFSKSKEGAVMKASEDPKFLYLSRREVEAVGITMEEIIKELEEAFAEKGQGRVEMPPKPGIHPIKDAFIHAMPAYIPSKKAAGVKWVSGYPLNFKIGLPYILGVIVLNDPESGLVLAIMDAAWVTAMRTAAATAIAAKHLARRDSGVLAILGCGMLARTNLEALSLVCPRLKTIQVHDVVQAHQTRFIAEMGAKFPTYEIRGMSDHRSAVEGADMVVSVISIQETPQPIIQKEWLKGGCFGAALAFDAGWAGPALASFDRIVTDDLPQFDYYRHQGFFQTTPPVDTELAEVVLGRKPGRMSDRERTLAINLGLAMEDMVTAKMVFERAKDGQIGTWLSLFG
jgi:ornithine cyclodeaminase/alanine dehydrogenase-like protein (mu-crystallin family)